MNPNRSESFEFQEYRRVAERAFTSAATSWAADDLPLLDGPREAEFEARVASLAPHFLDLGDVPEAEWGSRDSAVSQGLYQALMNPDVGVLVQGIADDLLKPDLAEVDEALRRAGLTPERLAELAAESDPTPPEEGPRAGLDQHRSQQLYQGPARTAYRPDL